MQEVSLDAVAPQLRESERRHRSLLLAALADARARKRAARAAGAAPAGPPPSPFVTLAGGTQQLVDALVEALRRMPHVGIRTQCLVEGLELEGARARVRFCGGEGMAPQATIPPTPPP